MHSRNCLILKSSLLVLTLKKKKRKKKKKKGLLVEYQRIHIEQVKSTCENSVFSEYNARRQKVSRWKTNGKGNPQTNNLNVALPYNTPSLRETNFSLFAIFSVFFFLYLYNVYTFEFILFSFSF